MDSYIPTLLEMYLNSMLVTFIVMFATARFLPAAKNKQNNRNDSGDKVSFAMAVMIPIVPFVNLFLGVILLWMAAITTLHKKRLNE